MSGVRRSGWWVVALGLVVRVPAWATSLEDCQRVITQFQGEVASVPVQSDRSDDPRAGLRKSLGAAAKAGRQSDVRAALDQLTRFEKEASAMEGRGELSRFDADRMVKGAQAAALCIQKARDGE